MRRFLIGATPFLVLAAMLVLRAWDPLVLQQLRWLAFDTYQRLEPRTYDPAMPVKIVDLDDESLARIGQWPWPRTRVAELLERLIQTGAAAIAFDIVFAEPDRSSPEQALELWPKTLEVLALRDSSCRRSSCTRRTRRSLIGRTARGSRRAGSLRRRCSRG